MNRVGISSVTVQFYITIIRTSQFERANKTNGTNYTYMQESITTVSGYRRLDETNQPHDTTLNQLHPSHILETEMPKIHFNVIFLSPSLSFKLIKIMYTHFLTLSSPGNLHSTCQNCNNAICRV